MTLEQKKLSNWNKVKSISQHEILFDKGESIRVDNLAKVVKRNEPVVSVIGSVIMGIGIGTLAYVSKGTVGFDHIEEFVLAGSSMIVIGIAIVTPPVFSRKKKSKIQIERLYRY